MRTAMVLINPIKTNVPKYIIPVMPNSGISTGNIDRQCINAAGNVFASDATYISFLSIFLSRKSCISIALPDDGEPKLTIKLTPLASFNRPNRVKGLAIHPIRFVHPIFSRIFTSTIPKKIEGIVRVQKRREFDNTSNYFKIL